MITSRPVSIRPLLAACATLIGLVATPAGAADGGSPRAALEKAKRVLVLGDSITHDGRWVADFAAWMESQGLDAEVINCGLPSETVSGLSEEGHAGGKFPRPDLAERLGRVLRVVKPDVVIACYGMNCGIYQPLDKERFAKFQAGTERLHAAAEKAGAKIIHLTPPVYDARPGKAGPAGSVDYDAVLTEYSKWLVSKRAAGWLVIDVHGPMRAALDKRRAEDPAFVFSNDTVHPGDEGHWAICRAVVAGIAGEKAVPDDLPGTLADFLPDATARMKLLRDAYLAAAGHTRPEMGDGLPVAEAEAKAGRIGAALRARRLQLRGTKHSSGEWLMDIEWPRPPVVDPGPPPAGPVPPPSDAIMLFGGRSLEAWEGGERWQVADGVATVRRGGSIQTKQAFGDCQLHVEFRTPTPPTGKGQGRGNSGVYLMGLYEVQILDSFEDGTAAPVTYPDGQCGAIYKQQPPAVNACRRPGEWQTFDILFRRPRFSADGSLEQPARISVLHNGVAIHTDMELKGPTVWHEPPRYQAHADELPLMLQEHVNPVQFRSIWIRPIEPLQPRRLDGN